jgi:hypothetical protein
LILFYHYICRIRASLGSKTLFPIKQYGEISKQVASFYSIRPGLIRRFLQDQALEVQGLFLEDKAVPTGAGANLQQGGFPFLS